MRLPEAQRLYRGTPIAIAALSNHADIVGQFIAFLKTEPAHEVFCNWGWK